MKKYILPVILLAVGAGIATSVSFAVKKSDCCGTVTVPELTNQ